MATHLIKKYIQEVAKLLRNLETYDDWDVGMEPIPGDRTWSKTKNQEKKMNQITKEEVQHLIDLAITRHNRNASIISLIVGLTVLGFYADGLFRTVEKLTNLN